MTTFNTSDEFFLRRAMELAGKGFGLASPNPNVGALLVSSDSKIVGEGFHTYDGVKHAEVLALEQAGERARGTTLYINLEPCCHTGRTGPCADALIAAGVKRVVACIPDPNPVVSGRGFSRLRQAGIQVTSHLLEEEAHSLNDAFAKFIRYRLPLVTLKAAMTLDGKIAPPPEDLGGTELHSAGGPGAGPTGGWITSEEARAHVQLLRHQHDSLLVGVGTIIADNPLLTDRSGLPRRRPLLRIIVDSHLRLPLESRVVRTAENDVLVFCSFAEEKKKHLLLEHGIQIEQVASAGPNGRPDLQAICQRLAEREITSVMIEGGAMVNWTALASRTADKVFFYYSPRILAGTGSVPFAAGAGFRKMTEAAHLKSFRLHRFGEDFAVEGYLRDPYLD
ncbi:MAG TPA: bifunctional diaminohydroxyphosphoribosylaminopyrimidine deaminase/5-amino-6-(5-phosphoribosylamino)uracil reductase RibD [Terriglobales bacterium]|nr:bifunctional diaminohydroxyphosphoribosylaminopyrimidine deaminase/5-amino-6-(5-phosphoribosylamino)uracil reductase RibD [Terriglobales bacterium]